MSSLSRPARCSCASASAALLLLALLPAAARASTTSPAPATAAAPAAPVSAGTPAPAAAPAAATPAAPVSAGTPAPAAAPAPREGFPLTVRVSGLRSNRGLVAVALFASAASFPEQSQALAGQVARVTRGGAAVTFPNVPPGVYAVAVLHDENENAKMDFNFLGMPLEGYGFSNDASALFGPPSFAAAKFRLSARPSYVAVKLRYLL